jgi:hypothetical protein
MRRRLAVVVAFVAFVAFVGCKPAADTVPSRTHAPGQPAAASRHARGEQVDANVPLASGDVLALADLRGKVVLLELSDAARRDPSVLADYERLVHAHGDRLAIVVVSLDAAGWDTTVADYHLGWDPAGALAARLHAATLPTVLVLDASGRIAHQYAGPRAPGHADALTAIDALLR